MATLGATPANAECDNTRKLAKLGWHDLPDELKLQVVGNLISSPDPIGRHQHEALVQEILVPLLRVGNQQLKDMVLDNYYKMNTFLVERAEDYHLGDDMEILGVPQFINRVRSLEISHRWFIGEIRRMPDKVQDSLRFNRYSGYYSWYGILGFPVHHEPLPRWQERVGCLENLTLKLNVHAARCPAAKELDNLLHILKSTDIALKAKKVLVEVGFLGYQCELDWLLSTVQGKGILYGRGTANEKAGLRAQLAKDMRGKGLTPPCNCTDSLTKALEERLKAP